MAGQQIGGQAFFKVNGVSYSTNGEFTGNILNTKKEPVTSSDGQVHYTSSVIPSTISGDLFLTEDLNPNFITSVTNAVIEVELVNGKSVLLTDAFYSGDGSTTVVDGTIGVEFSGIGTWI
jgi:hypothetical protein